MIQRGANPAILLACALSLPAAELSGGGVEAARAWDRDDGIIVFAVQRTSAS
jgi:hypothetical protein